VIFRVSEYISANTKCLLLLAMVVFLSIALAGLVVNCICDFRIEFYSYLGV